MLTTSYPYKTTTTLDKSLRRSPKYDIATEPHYKITEYLEEDSINIPNRKILKKIITNALTKKKYQGSIDLNMPGNKNVLTDSDSEHQYIDMKKINKNMLKQNGSANLIIKKIESQGPQRNEEYYKFTNQKKIYPNNDPIYGTRTYANWNHQRINKPRIKQAQPLYIQTEQNDYRNYDNNKYSNYYTNNRINANDNIKNKANEDYNNNNNYFFNSSVDLRNINYNKNQKNKSPNQQIDYDSSADAEQGSSSYVYIPARTTDLKNRNMKKKIIKENEFSSQSISEEPYIKKNFEIRTQKIRTNNKYRIPLNRPTINELINMNYDNKGFSVLQNKFNQKLVKNIVKIQSTWRGYFTREIINKNLNLIRFLIVLMENIKTKYFEYITEIFYGLRNTKIKSEKNENYDDLLKDYNLILKEYEKIEKELNEIKKIQKINHFDNLNIVKKENNFEILDIHLETLPEKTEDKKAVLIKPESKEQFTILKNNENKTRLRNKYKNINEENKFKEYINHFTSNINITNPAQFKIEEKKSTLSEESNLKNKKDLLIEEHQKEMNIELKLKRQFEDNMTKENINDINIISIVTQKPLKENKLNKYNHEFNDDSFVIVKKININIKKEKQNKINNYMIEKNIINIKKIKKDKKDKSTEISEDNNNKKIEIEKLNSLEINPKEIKKEENKEEKPIEKKEKKAVKAFTEKAKYKMMKMILPIRLKGTLVKLVQKRILKMLKGLKKD